MAFVYLLLYSIPDYGMIWDYSYIMPVGSKRSHEEMIPLEEFKREYWVYRYRRTENLQGDLLTRIREIRLRFGKEGYSRFHPPEPIADDFTGTVWLDNLKFVQANFGPLYDYPAVISTIDGQDVTHDFDNDIWEHKTYEKFVAIDDHVEFDVVATDHEGMLESLDSEPVSSMTPFTFDVSLNSAKDIATGHFTWDPSESDYGIKTVKFSVAGIKGDKDEQELNLVVTDPFHVVPPGWPLFAPYGYYPSPAVADLDLDGEQEIVFANEAYHSDGTLVWSVPIEDYVTSYAPAIGEIADIPGLETTVQDGGKLHLIDANGNILDTAFGSPAFRHFDSALGDIDGDGFEDIMVRYPIASNYYTLIALTWNPATQAMDQKWRIEEDFWTNPVPIDADFDGLVDMILISSYDDVLYAYTVSPDWSDPVLSWQIDHGVSGYYIDNEPCVVDIDGDNKLEIVILAGARLFAYELDGTLVSGLWPVYIPGSGIYSRPVLGDIVGGDNGAAD